MNRSLLHVVLEEWSCNIHCVILVVPRQSHVRYPVVGERGDCHCGGAYSTYCIVALDAGYISSGLLGRILRDSHVEFLPNSH
jgi:hypothetical protein